MKLSDYMNAAATANAPATGERVGRQMVLALDCSDGTGTAVSDYAVIANHVENVGGCAECQDNRQGIHW